MSQNGVAALLRHYFSMLHNSDEPDAAGATAAAARAITAGSSGAARRDSRMSAAERRGQPLATDKPATLEHGTLLAQQLHYTRPTTPSHSKLRRSSTASSTDQSSSPNMTPTSKTSPYCSPSMCSPSRRRRRTSSNTMTVRYDTSTIKRSRQRQLHQNVSQYALQRKARYTMAGPRHSQSFQGLTSHLLPNKPQSLHENEARVFCSKFNDDGSKFMIATQDHHMKIYNTYSRRVQNAQLQRQRLPWKPVKDIHCRHISWSIIDCDFEPAGNYIVYSTWSNYINLVNVSGDSEMHESLDLRPTSHRFCVFSLKFSNDGSEVLCGCSDEKVYLYDLQTKQRLFVVHGHHDDVNAIAWLDDQNQVFASGSDDATIRLWDRRTLSTEGSEGVETRSGRYNQPVGSLIGHTDGITFIDTKNDGRHLLSNGKDQSAKLWDVRAMQAGNAQPRTRERQFDYRYQLYGIPRRRRTGARATPASDDDDVADNEADQTMATEYEMEEDAEAEEEEDEDYDYEYDDEDEEGDEEGEEVEVEVEVEGDAAAAANAADEDLDNAELREAIRSAMMASGEADAEEVDDDQDDDDEDAADDEDMDANDDADDNDGTGWTDSAYEADSGGNEYSQSQDTRSDRDYAIMSYRGHRVLETLIRCRFSPAATTGQKYVYSGSQDGDVHIYDILTGQVVHKLSRGHDETVRDVSWHPSVPQILSSSWDGNCIMWNRRT